MMSDVRMPVFSDFKRYDFHCLVEPMGGYSSTYIIQCQGRYYGERSEFLICKVHQLGLGCIKNCAH